MSEAVKAIADTGQRNAVGSMEPKGGRPLLKQPTLDYAVNDKYTELLSFE